MIISLIWINKYTTAFHIGVSALVCILIVGKSEVLTQSYTFMNLFITISIVFTVTLGFHALNIIFNIVYNLNTNPFLLITI